jgi:FHS family L-fucose permease-like MFS transporter
MHTATDFSAGSHLPSQAAPSRHRVALTLVISLFFAWGLTYGLLDVLNKHFQQTLSVSRMESVMLQTCYFGAYLLVAVPSGFFVSRYGYRRGILLGLVLFATGALLFIPATALARFGPFHQAPHVSRQLPIRTSRCLEIAAVAHDD